jgi:hypothetical protein
VHGWFDAGSSQLVTCPACGASIRITGLYADPDDTGEEAAGLWVVTTQQTTDPARHGVGWPAMVAAEVDVTTTRAGIPGRDGDCRTNRCQSSRRPHRHPCRRRPRCRGGRVGPACR